MKLYIAALMLLALSTGHAIAVDPWDCFVFDGSNQPVGCPFVEGDMGPPCPDTSFTIPILPDLQNYLCSVGTQAQWETGCEFERDDDEDGDVEQYTLVANPYIVKSMLSFIEHSVDNELGDVNNDGVVDTLDLIAVVAAWGPCDGCVEDINENGIVEVTDLLIVVNRIGITNWSLNTPYIHQVGDLVMGAGMVEEWVYADFLIGDTIGKDGGKLLWGISTGNHDGCFCNAGDALYCGNRYGVPKLDYPTQRFDEWFPPSRWGVAGQEDEAGEDDDLHDDGRGIDTLHPRSMANSCFYFEAAGCEWMFINLGYYAERNTRPCTDDIQIGPPKNEPTHAEVIEWADKKMKAHLELCIAQGKISKVVLGQHSLIDGWMENPECEGTFSPRSCWTNEGWKTWNGSYEEQGEVIRLNENPNLVLMISGHRIEDEHGHRVELRTGLNPVHVIMVNYQDYCPKPQLPGNEDTSEHNDCWVRNSTLPEHAHVNGGHGFIHFMRISCNGLRADFTTYSPYLEELGECPCTCNPYASYSIAIGQQGDVNADGLVDSSDKMAVCLAMDCTWDAETQTCDFQCPPVECFHCIEDINGDNIVNSDDLNLVLY